MSYPLVEIEKFLCSEKGFDAITDRSYTVCPDSVSPQERRESLRQATRYVAESYARQHYDLEDFLWIRKELNKLYGTL